MIRATLKRSFALDDEWLSNDAWRPFGKPHEFRGNRLSYILKGFRLLSVIFWYSVLEPASSTYLSCNDRRNSYDDVHGLSSQFFSSCLHFFRLLYTIEVIGGGPYNLWLNALLATPWQSCRKWTVTSNADILVVLKPCDIKSMKLYN
jgi:hypothetical protein